MIPTTLLTAIVGASSVSVLAAPVAIPTPTVPAKGPISDLPSGSVTILSPRPTSTVETASTPTSTSTTFPLPAAKCPPGLLLCGTEPIKCCRIDGMTLPEPNGLPPALLPPVPSTSDIAIAEAADSDSEVNEHDPRTPDHKPTIVIVPPRYLCPIGYVVCGALADQCCQFGQGMRPTVSASVPSSDNSELDLPTRNDPWNWGLEVNPGGEPLNSKRSEDGELAKRGDAWAWEENQNPGGEPLNSENYEELARRDSQEPAKLSASAQPDTATAVPALITPENSLHNRKCLVWSPRTRHCVEWLIG